MKAGLLGAIGGVGKALEGFGSDLQKRREQALEDARELAKEERRRAERKEETAENRAFTLDRDEAREKAINARTDKTIAATAARQEAGFRNKAETAKETEARMRRMADYNDRLSRSRTVASQQTAAAIRNGEVVDAFTSGKPVKRPDGQMREQIMHELGDGTIVATGQWITPGSKMGRAPQRKKAAASSMIDDLNLDEEEEEEEE